VSEQNIIIGAPQSSIPGSRPFTCEDCGADVHLAPSGQQLRSERNLRVLCLRCGLALASESGEPFERLTPEQIEEIVEEATAPRPGIHPW